MLSMPRRSKDVEAAVSPAAAHPLPSSGAQLPHRNRYAAWVVLALGLTVAAGMTLYVKSTVDKAARQEFISRCEDIRAIIADRMDAHAGILLSGAALFGASTQVTREEWRAFTQYQKIGQRLPGIQGIGFSLLIPPAALPGHIDAVRAEGFPQYTVRPEGAREVYSAILYLEPFSGRNLRAFGYDMLSEPVRRTAMERARDTDRPALSGKVVLVQETEKAVQAGTLMYVAVYRKGMPTDSPEQRRAALYGWVYSPYRMDDLMQGVLGTRDQSLDQQIHLSVFDGRQPSPQSLLHRSFPAENETPSPGVRFSRQMGLDFNGHPWTLCCTQAGGGAFTAADAQVWFVTVASTLVALLLFSLVRVLENTGVAARRRADELSCGLRESERRHRSIIQTAMDGFWQADAQGRLLAVNDTYCRMSGYCEAELLGMRISELGVSETADGVASHIARIMTEGEDRFESRHRRKNGTVYDVEVSVQSQFAVGGHLVAFLRDITQRKRTEAELSRLAVIQGELMRLATKFVNVPVERQDAAVEQSLATMGQLIEADRAYLFKYDFGAGRMHYTHEWCGPNITPESGHLQAVPLALFPEWVAAHRRGEAVHVPSVAALAADDPLRQALEPRGIRSLVTLPLLGDEACTGFVGFGAVREERRWRDDEVSLLRVLARLYAHFEARRAADRENRELQTGLALARDAAQEAARAKSLFLANMSHESRTPLNAILGNAQIMERDCRACPTGHRLHAISRSGEHLLQLINDLLELVRSETNAIPLSPTDFDFHQVLEDVRLMFAQQPAAQDVVLAVSCAPDVPRFINADQGRIRQVLVNLLGNALKFTGKGSVRLTATVPAERSAGDFMLAVDVEDTGSGIAADELPRVFDVFYLAEGGRKVGRGTGLGLPLSQRYARDMGGDVTATSRLGEGSCFRFTFQARLAKGAVVERVLQRSVRRLAPGQDACRILVVDDDLTNRDVLIALLQPVGFPVEGAATAVEALERLRQTPHIGLVLLDKLMPGMDGYTAIGHIRRLPGGSAVRIVVVTAVGLVAERGLALAAGADGYVAKPVRRKALLAEIARVTDLRYDYDDEVPGVVPAVRVPVVVSPEALAGLPLAQRQALELALRRGDIQQLRDLVGALAPTDAGLAAGMRLLVDAYDYDRLQGLLQAAKREA
jgi:PAS domain S-box-containing protein